MVKMNKKQIIDDFCKHYCIVCKQKIMVFCGTPVIHIGGCCCGVTDEETKTKYIYTVKCHYHCYQQKKGDVKTMWKYNEIKEIINE